MRIQAERLLAPPPLPRRDQARNWRKRLNMLQALSLHFFDPESFFPPSSAMVNPMLLLSLLNASTPTTTNVECYEQRPPGQIQLPSTTYIVCTQAINSITTGRTLNTPVLFGRAVKVGHKLPDEFVHEGFYGTCVVRIDMKDGEQDTLTWRDVVVSASALRDSCVAPPPHLGGEVKAGPRQLLNIKIYGLPKEVDVSLPVGSSALAQDRAFDG